MKTKESILTINAEVLNPDEKKELHDCVRKIARKRKREMKAPLMYRLNFGGTRNCASFSVFNEAQRDS